MLSRKTCPVAFILLACIAWNFSPSVFTAVLADDNAMPGQRSIQPRKDQYLQRKAPANAMLAPRLTRLETMDDCYTLTGSGFGSDKSQVRVFEGRMALPPSAIVSVADDRIVARSRPAGIVQHSVTVSGRASNALIWSHPTVSVNRSPRETYTEKQTGMPIRSQQVQDSIAQQLPAVRRAESTAPKTIAVTTGALQMTGPGMGAASVKLTTGALQMTGPGMGAASVKLTTGALQMTGPGMGAASVKLTTGALQMTGPGVGAAPVKLTTSALQMTGSGVGVASVRLTTGKLQMTGLGL